MSGSASIMWRKNGELWNNIIREFLSIMYMCLPLTALFESCSNTHGLRSVRECCCCPKSMDRALAMSLSTTEVSLTSVPAIVCLCCALVPASASVSYRIAGNFRMVQIFVYFAWSSHMRKYKLRIFKYTKFLKRQILNGYTTNQSGNDPYTCEVQSSNWAEIESERWRCICISTSKLWTPFLTPADLCRIP